MRIEQPKGARGSLKWIQLAVNHAPDSLQPSALPQIEWRSPMRSDGFAEYRDGAFLERLGLADHASHLGEFWPRRGPQWDALGTFDGGIVLVEAKAHLGEFLTPRSQAGEPALALIRQAFQSMQTDLGLTPPSDWTRTYYQYANRLAFLWWLRARGINAHLLLVNFLNDEDMMGPVHAETWEAAFAAANYALGIPKSTALLRHIHHLMPDVHDLERVSRE